MESASFSMQAGCLSSYCLLYVQAKGLSAFPVDVTYMPAVQKRVSLACEVDKVLRKHSQVITRYPVG
jgi:hypothetical protein